MSEKLYKLTNAKGMTRFSTQWGEGVTHTAPGGRQLCTKAWIHAYRTPEQAVFMAPQYGYAYADSLLWECEGEVGIDDGTKVGCTSLTTLGRVEKPTLTTEQRVETAIRVAMEVYHGEIWTTWARRWLDGTDRTGANAAYAAYAAHAHAADAAVHAAYAAAYAAYAAPAYAATAAANAAKGAARVKMVPLCDILARVVSKHRVTP